jgi:excisionase family DNA binding protein
MMNSPTEPTEEPRPKTEGLLCEEHPAAGSSPANAREATPTRAPRTSGTRRPRTHLGPDAALPATRLPALLTVAEAAAYMGVRVKTVYAWVAAGRLPCLRAGGAIRFEYDALIAWLGGREERRL